MATLVAAASAGADLTRDLMPPWCRALGLPAGPETVRVLDQNGATPLMIATGRPEIAALLQAAGAK